ncbi:hypothetical protein [Paraburkholderia terrae]
MEANLVASAVHAASAIASAAHVASSTVSSAAETAVTAASIPSASGAVADDTFWCLGIRAFGRCQYNPLKPNNSYLTLGDALAALGLVIAFLQLGTPTVRLRNRIRAKVIYCAFGLFGLVFIFTAYAALIPSLYSSSPASPLGYPVVWELSGTLCGLAAFVTIAFSYFLPTRFRPGNARQFADAAVYTLSTGDTDALRALSVEVGRNVGLLVGAATAGIEALRRKEVVPDYQIAALQLLQMLSDRRFCRVVVDSSPSTAVSFVEELNSHDASGEVGHAFLQELSVQAVVSPDSILAKEDDYVGLGHFGMYTRALYGNYQFVARRFGLFDGWESYRADEVSLGATQRYGRALKVAVEGYFEANDFYSQPRVLRGALKRLSSLFRDQMWQLHGVSIAGIHQTTECKIASEIVDIYQHILDTIIKKEVSVPAAYELKRDEGNGVVLVPAIYEFFAEGYFELIQSAAVDRGHDDTLRDLMENLYSSVNGLPGERTRVLVEIQQRVLAKLSNKLTDNLVAGYYPLVTRQLCCLVGVWESSNVPSDDPRMTFATPLFHDALREHFATAYLVNPEKAQELVGDFVTFDSENLELVQTSPYGRKSTLKVKAASDPKGSRFGHVKRAR